MDALEPNNVIYLHQRGRWPTYCLDCDPSCTSPFDLAFRKDVRTGDILTPCPSCGRSALVEVPRAAARRSRVHDR
jgi:hypothetical protein